MQTKLCKKKLHNYDDSLGRCPECKKLALKKYYKQNKQKYQNYYFENKEKVNERATKRHYIKKYGLTIEDKIRMVKEQNGKCANKNCNYHFSDLYDAQIDHCHTTGMIRGILCNGCNAALGYLKEDIKILEGLKEYIIFYGEHNAKTKI